MDPEETLEHDVDNLTSADVLYVVYRVIESVGRDPVRLSVLGEVLKDRCLKVERGDIARWARRLGRDPRCVRFHLDAMDRDEVLGSFVNLRGTGHGG